MNIFRIYNEFGAKYSNILTPSNVHFRENQFILNHGKILSVDGVNKLAVYITGPFSIMHNVENVYRHKDLIFYHNRDLIFIYNMIVYIYGPLIISHNSAKHGSIWQFVFCEIIIYGMIFFKYNVCSQVMFLNMQQPYIKVMECANITFVNNVCNKKLIEVAIDNSWYNYCLFSIHNI